MIFSWTIPWDLSKFLSKTKPQSNWVNLHNNQMEMDWNEYSLHNKRNKHQAKTGFNRREPAQSRQIQLKPPPLIWVGKWPMMYLNQLFYTFVLFSKKNPNKFYLLTMKDCYERFFMRVKIWMKNPKAVHTYITYNI